MTSEHVSPSPGDRGRPPARLENVSALPPAGRGARHCPDCGAAVINLSATRCWLCDAPLPSGGQDEAPGRDGNRPPTATRETSVVMVLLGILFLIWSFGLATEAPGVLIVALIVLTPVLIRTGRSVAAQKERGESPGGLAVVGQFLSSVGVVVMVGLAAGAAFYATCFAICLGGMALGSLDRHGSEASLLILSVAGGAVVGIYVLVVMIRRIWRAR